MTGKKIQISTIIFDLINDDDDDDGDEDEIILHSHMGCY